MNEYGYTFLLNGYIQSVFQNFESFLRIKRVSEDEIELVLKQYNSKFITYEITPGICSKNGISDALKSFGCQVKYDDISKKTSLLTDKNLRFDKNSILVLYWDLVIIGFAKIITNLLVKKLQIYVL